MTTTFEDNQAVTLADLNNVAVDLGATTFSAFSEEKFGVDKLNQITADLVTAGILRTEDAGELGLEIGCRPTYANGIVTIGHGTIVFASGAKAYIDAPVEVEAAAGSYIYALNDILTGRASLQAAESEPTEGDLVMLASISAEGVLTDKRTVAKSKVLLTTDGMLRTFSAYFPGRYYEAPLIEYTIEIQGDFSYIIGWSFYNKSANGQNAFSISDGNAVTFNFENDHVWVRISREGNSLKYTAGLNGSGSVAAGYFNFSVI